jgi:glycosyltransferase involved in cell wall biosynthesis
MTQPVSIVIPAYNEAGCVAAVVRSVADVLTHSGIQHEIIVVDDGSADATAKAAESASATVLRHRANRGYGAALKTGILAAKHPTICILDADSTYPPEALPELIAEKEHADMVVGARTGKSVHIPLLRRPAKWVLNKLANYVTQTRIPDLNSGMRVFDRNIALQYFNILSDQFSFTTTITMAMLCDRYAVRYVPIDYGRRVGKSKIIPWDAATFTVLILRLAMLFRPLRVFLPVAFLSLVYAVVKACWDLLITGDRMISTTAAVAALSALHLTLIGMLGDAVATRLRHMNGILYHAQQQRDAYPDRLRPTRFEDERVA